MKDFFISYNRADKKWAEWIAWQLEEAGYTTVIQAWDFRPGSNFVLEMQKAAKEAKRTIAVLSPDYLNARFTKAEWAAAFAQDPTGEKGTLMPVRVRKCELKGLLSQIIYIDLVDLEEEALRKTALLEGLQHNKRIKPKTKAVLSNEIQNFEKGIKRYKSQKHKFDDFGKAGQKYAKKIEDLYGIIRIFGSTKPVPLRGIYTRVNILEKILSRHPINIDELEKYFDSDRRGFGHKQETRPGMEVVNNLQKFIILGKPGSGKTTFLKYITIQAKDGKMDKTRIPIFIGLKDFSDSDKSSLLDFIISQFDGCDFHDAGSFIEKILKKGKALLLLDGLDEVSKDKTDKIIKDIRDFSNKYSDNQFIISCRIAAYNYYFEKFTDVELSDFNDEQIKNFIDNWFGIDTKKALSCWKKLEENESIKELAAIPLLLSMLCLSFDETMNFSHNKAELYKDTLDVLLKKWDVSKRIERDEVYKNFPLRYKEIMLSRIAATTFEKGQYFVTRRTLENLVMDFVQNLQGVKKEELTMDSEVILKSIEAQHGILVERAKGIYSFSHLTFQEYFTAKYIVDNSNKGTLINLIENHLYEDKWREVFLLTAEMLAEADDLILKMKIKIDSFLSNKSSKKIGDFIKIIQKDVVKKNINYSPSASRALAIFLVINYIPIKYSERAHSLGVGIGASLFYPNRYSKKTIANIKGEHAKAVERSHDPDLARVRSLAYNLASNLNIEQVRIYERVLALVVALNPNYDPNTFPRVAPVRDEDFSRYSIDNQKLDEARSLALDFDHAVNIDRIHALAINFKQELLNELLIYMDANLLITDCLNRNCYVSKETRQKISDELLTVLES